MLSEINRCQNMLNNPNFVSRAPQEKVDQEKQKLENYQKQLNEIEKSIKELE